VGSNLQTADEINGGDGTDYVVFEGDYTTATGNALSLGAATLTDVEYFIMSGGYDYDITLHNNTFSSATATIQGGGLASGDILTIDASAETATNITISSGDANDSLTGGAGADTINGGNGNDTLTGGSGNNVFQFNSTTAGNDTITDFSHANDIIVLNSAAQFAGLALTGTAAVDANELLKGAGKTTSETATDFLIYNTTDGALYYDADAAGEVASAVQIATLTGSPDDLDITDFALAAFG
ncbi:MAG TPA: calcium-binding protein, partial [Candidatus Thioglobus sp.]|nr:calcium-binding protein [Candidatus Thioglobus sp.]